MTSDVTFGADPSWETDTSFATSLAQKDAKTALNQFCQRFCSRPVTKADIEYSVQRYPGGYQATVRLNCIEGQEFAGELAATQKEAEKMASQQALDFYADQINSMPMPGTGKKKKRPAGDGWGAGAPAKMPCLPGEEPDPSTAANPSLSAKSELNSTCSKILRRVMEKGEVVYETHQCIGGYQATVRMPGLPGEWGQQVWAGQVHFQKKDAEQSAAQIALDILRADPGLMAAHDAPPKPKNWSPFQGKGRGRGGVQKGGKGLQVAANAANQWNAAAASSYGNLAPW